MMSGSGNYTLSPRQVERLLNETNATFQKARSDVENQTLYLFDILAGTWADANAVIFARDLAVRMNNLVGSLSTHFNNLARGIVDLNNTYARAANKPQTPYYPNVSITSAISSNGKVSDFFKNGENPDDFGFRGGNQGEEKFKSGFNEFRKKFIQFRTDLLKSVNSINAFGNNDIKVAIANCVKQICDAADVDFQNIERNAEAKLADTRAKYQKISG